MQRFTILLLILIITLALAGCAGEQPASQTPGQKAAPFTRDRSHSK